MRSEQSEYGRFTILACALFAFICAVPFISEVRFGLFLLRAGMILLLIAAVYSVSERRWQLILAVVLALPPVATLALHPLLGASQALMVRMGMSALFFIYIAVLTARFLLKQDRVSADIIVGAINVYLLFAIGFTFLHAFVELVKPGAYLYQGAALGQALQGEPEIDALAFLLYFSVVTLTTLGYGDITPAIPAARMLCSLEAVIGQLFVAIFIARLVSLHISHRSR